MILRYFVVMMILAVLYPLEQAITGTLIPALSKSSGVYDLFLYQFLSSVHWNWLKFFVIAVCTLYVIEGD